LPAASRSLAERLSAASKRLLPLLDAVLIWVDRQAGFFEAPEPAPSLTLRLRAGDGLLLLSVLVLALALLGVLLRS
jgi:hypothetical protein